MATLYTVQQRGQRCPAVQITLRRYGKKLYRSTNSYVTCWEYVFCDPFLGKKDGSPPLLAMTSATIILRHRRRWIINLTVQRWGNIGDGTRSKDCARIGGVVLFMMPQDDKKDGFDLLLLCGCCKVLVRIIVLRILYTCYDNPSCLLLYWQWLCRVGRMLQ